MNFHKKEATSTVALEMNKLNLFEIKPSVGQVMDCAEIHSMMQFSLHTLREFSLMATPSLEVEDSADSGQTFNAAILSGR